MSGRRQRDDRGSAHAELILLAVVFFVFVAVIIFVGQVNVGSAHAEAAARAAARTISLSRDPEAAVAEAEAQASSIALEGTPVCSSMDFDADISATEVTVDVSCEVDLSAATLAEVPGSMVRSASATEVIDQYRETAP